MKPMVAVRPTMVCLLVAMSQAACNGDRSTDDENADRGTETAGDGDGDAEGSEAETTGDGDGDGDAEGSETETSGDGDGDGDGDPGCTAVQWARRFGDEAFQAGSSVAVDAQGNIIVTGYYNGDIDFRDAPLASAGGFDIYLAKLDPEGNVLWSQRFGDATNQYAGSVAVDAQGNIFVSGSFDGTIDLGGGPLVCAGPYDVFLAKLDPAGNHLWSKHFGDAMAQYGDYLAVDAGGNVLISGSLSGSIDFGGGSLGSVGQSDIYLAKLDGFGNHVWSKRFGNSSNQHPNGLAIDATGNVLMVGEFVDDLSLGGPTLTNGGLFDVFVAKFDPNGTHLWSHGYGDGEWQTGGGIAVDAQDNVIVTGRLGGTVDFGGGALGQVGSWDVFALGLGPSGEHLWSRRFGDGQDEGTSVAVDGSGNVLLTGQYTNLIDLGGGPLSGVGGPDVFVAKLDGAANHLWSRAFVGPGQQYGWGIATDVAGNVLSFGNFEDTIDLGCEQQLVSAGEADVFLVKMAP